MPALAGTPLFRDCLIYAYNLGNFLPKWDSPDGTELSALGKVSEYLGAIDDWTKFWRSILGCSAAMYGWAFRKSYTFKAPKPWINDIAFYPVNFSLHVYKKSSHEKIA